MVVQWTREGTRIIGRVNGTIAVELRAVRDGWEWKLAIEYVDRALLSNPFAMLPRMQAVARDEGEATQGAMLALNALNAA